MLNRRYLALGVVTVLCCCLFLLALSLPVASTQASAVEATLNPTPLGGSTGKILFGTGPYRSPTHAICIVSSDGSGEKCLTDPAKGAGIGGFTWLADGKRFAFAENGESGIVIMNADSTNQRVLPNAKTFYDWSPDGQHIVQTKFVSSLNVPGTTTDDYARFDIVVTDPEGNNPRTLVAGVWAYDELFPAWSPDGQHLSYVESQSYSDNIYVVSLDGSQPTNLTNSTGKISGLSGPSWSPDSQHIAYLVSSPSGDEIHIVSIDGRTREALSHQLTALNNLLYWSPDGRKIAFTAKTNGSDHYHVYSIELSTNHFQDLTPDSTTDNWVIGWNPDSKRILVTDTDYLYVANLDQAVRLKLPRPTFLQVDTIIPLASWSPDGNWILFTTIKGLYIMDANGQHMKLLTKGPYGEINNWEWQPLPQNADTLSATTTALAPNLILPPINPASLAAQTAVQSTLYAQSTAPFASATRQAQWTKTPTSVLDATLFAEATNILASVTEQARLHLPTQTPPPTYTISPHVQITQTSLQATLFSEATNILATVTKNAELTSTPQGRK